jgi:hypothetical protein
MPRPANKRLTTQVVQVDLRDLKAHGWFLWVPGGHAFRIEDRLVIDWHGKRFAVPMTQTEPHYGGQRFWFCCARCGRRARIVYSPEFNCRRCSKLLHLSTRQSKTDRAISRAVEIRRSLGGSGSLLEPFPPRPAGMRRRSWLRLWSTCQRYEQLGSEGAAAMLERLSARLIRASVG